MIDFTKIQTVPVPPPIEILQNSNSALSKENNTLKMALYISAGIALLAVVYFALKKQRENEVNKENKFNRD